MAILISVQSMAPSDHPIMCAWLKDHGIDPRAVFQVAINAAKMEATIYEYERNAQGRFVFNETRDAAKTREPYSIPIRTFPTVTALARKAVSLAKVD